MSAAVFVDLSNFYGHLLNCGYKDRNQLRDYFANWLDFDRLAMNLTREHPTIWIFYSHKRLGPTKLRIQGSEMNNYIKRINGLEGVTARNVDIPGEERDSVDYLCPKCKHEGSVELPGEKGVDASLTVHLCDTMQTWDRAYLLSGDADFVPVVRTLRRLGKIVIGAGCATPSYALIRECFDYIDLWDRYIKDDFCAYLLFLENGLVHHWLSDEVVQANASGTNIKFWVRYYSPTSVFLLSASGPVKLKGRIDNLTQYLNQIPELQFREIRGSCEIEIDADAWLGVEKRMPDLLANFPDVDVERLEPQLTISKEYLYDKVLNQYKPVED